MNCSDIEWTLSVFSVFTGLGGIVIGIFFGWFLKDKS